MRSFLYSPSYLAEIIYDLDLAERTVNHLLVQIWENERCFLFAEHQRDKKKFIKDVMNETNYLFHCDDIDAESNAVNRDLNAIGSDELEYDTEDFNYISKMFIEMRLKMLFIGKQDYIRMKFRTLLERYGYKRRTAALLTYMHKCLYFYHIETYLRDNTPCNIEDVKLDDMITFRVLENQRSLPKKNNDYCIEIKPDKSQNIMPIVKMNSSTMEVMLGDKKVNCSLYALKQVNGEVDIEICGRHFKVAVLSGSIREIFK